MGTIIDEETGEEPVCMFCGSGDDCAHLVAAIDQTFAECVGGALYEAIDDLRNILSKRILARLKSGESFQPVSSGREISAIIEEAEENYHAEYPDDVYIDEHMFLAWLTEQLIDFGADEPTGHIVEEGGPGQSSALTLLYAAEPQNIIRCVEKALADAVADL